MVTVEQSEMKRTIYIVDDQHEVLETAVLIVRGVLPEAEVTGFLNPREALAAVQAHPPDLILSDHMMPEMHGSELLDGVREASPTTVRIIMSGYVGLDRLTVITSAHQYVPKPFDAVELKHLLERTFAAQDRLVDPALREVVTALRTLPSLPQVRHSLLLELQDEYGAAATIGNLIAQDAGLTAKVLQLANSTLFGREYLVTNPGDAVTCLGTAVVASIVLSQTLFKHYADNSHPEVNLPQIWNHCWETAALAQFFCREKSLPRATGEAAFLSGLLHETGRLVLVDNFPEKYQAACDAARAAKSSLGPRLREIFGTTASDVGAYLLDLWGMPSAVVAAISFLERPEEEHPKSFSLTSALYIADQLASRRFAPDPFPPTEWSRLYVRSVGGPEELAAWEKRSKGQKSV